MPIDKSALENLQQAVAANPGFAEGHLAIGNILKGQNKFEAAISSFRSAINARADFELAYISLGQTLRAQSKLDETIVVYRQGLAKVPSSAALHLNLGSVLLESEQFSEAFPSIERALSLDPNCAEIFPKLGQKLVDRGQLTEAVRLVNLMPKNPRSLMFLADAFNRMGRTVDAIECWREVIALKPDYVLPYHFILIHSHFLPSYSREKIFSDHVECGERFESPWKHKWLRHSKPHDIQRKLRVGFVSGDLIAHPVGYFLEGVLKELHIFDQINIIVYSNNSVVDAVTERIRAQVNEWVMIDTLSDDAVERRILNDKIDILVDLSGHTNGNRLGVFARKPAPIQISWLGYWDTTGLRSIDYILCDKFGIHSDEVHLFVEQPWYLPDTRLCFTLPSEEIAIAPLPALSNGWITFGCFNSLLKLTDRVIANWSRILKRIPTAHLLLKWSAYADRCTCESVIARFEKEGIAGERIDLEASSPRQEYFLAYDRVDIALDPFPFPGGTTSIEGIWMGVPMITLKGDRIISRQGEAILQNLSMPDWVANDEDEYVEMAVKMASDLAALAKLRNELRKKLASSPLCDTELFARNLQSAFRQMWEKYCNISTGSS